MTKEKNGSSPVALAVVAHPDDIEFFMVGTMLLLKDTGADICFWNLANGCMGSIEFDRETLARMRREEAVESAGLAGAAIRDPLFDDLAIFHDAESLAQVAAGIREINPTIVLTHPPADYMEDHMCACRLALNAAFVRGAPNFETVPPQPAVQSQLAVYHCMPVGLMGPLREKVEPDFYVDIGEKLPLKRDMLACHRSQKEWLDVSQGHDSYLSAMEEMAGEMGRRSGCFQYAEGWRRHNHLGYCDPGFDPLTEMLKGKIHEPSNQ